MIVSIKKIKYYLNFFWRFFFRENKTKKIFCIGFNKTGTTSLHHFFQDCGLLSLHNFRWTSLTHIKNKSRFNFIYDAYSDGENSDFKYLEEKFPESLFIFNYRDEKEWLYSRVKHALVHKPFAAITPEFNTHPELAIKKWICEFRLYFLQASSYFKGKPNYIEIDITKTENWPEILLSFFQENKLKLAKIPSLKKEYFFNSRKNNKKKIEDKHKTLLTQYLLLVDKVLLDMGDFKY